jgi:hypothetical protein
LGMKEFRQDFKVDFIIGEELPTSKQKYK